MLVYRGDKRRIQDFKCKFAWLKTSICRVIGVCLQGYRHRFAGL